MGIASFDDNTKIMWRIYFWVQAGIIVIDVALTLLFLRGKESIVYVLKTYPKETADQAAKKILDSVFYKKSGVEILTEFKHSIGRFRKK